MDKKTLVGKSLFFLALCLFVTAFSVAFGQENLLIGVFIVILGLMMLGKDLSVRPIWNLGALLISTLALGLGAYLSLLDPFLGVVVNSVLVFVTVFITMHDLNSPLHFPFLLGYAFMLAMPVSAEDLPVRLLALAIGSVLIVGLNYVINRNRMARTGHESVISICRMISEDCESIASGGDPGTERLDAICSDVNRKVHGRLQDRFYCESSDRSLVDMVASLQTLGRAVCTRDHDAGTLHSISSLMTDLASHEDGDMDLDSLKASFDRFFKENPGASMAIVTSLRAVMLELETMEGSGEPSVEGKAPHSFRIGTIMRENLRTDSLRFSFAIRMTVLFVLWAFVWQYWDLENAKWLLFTTVAIVQPYVDGSFNRSVKRLTGTLVGSFAFVIIAVLSGGSLLALTVTTMVVGYVYTVWDPKEYDLMNVFITLMALLSAVMVDPSEPVVMERVLYVFLGVALATLANHALMPYRLKDENKELSTRYLQISSRRLDNLSAAARGEDVDAEERYLRLTADSISMKMQVNVGHEANPNLEVFLSSQNSFMVGCTMIRNALPLLGDSCKGRLSTILTSRDGSVSETSSLEGMSDTERDVLMMAEDLVRSHSENRALYVDVVTGA